MKKKFKNPKIKLNNRFRKHKHFFNHKGGKEFKYADKRNKDIKNKEFIEFFNLGKDKEGHYTKETINLRAKYIEEKQAINPNWRLSSNGKYIIKHKLPNNRRFRKYSKGNQERKKYKAKIREEEFKNGRKNKKRQLLKYYYSQLNYSLNINNIEEINRWNGLIHKLKYGS